MSRATCFFLVGFLALYLSFAFLVTKAPNYTRLLVVVPFVAYLAVQAIRFLAERAGGLAARRSWAPERRVVAGTAALLVAAVGAWNLAHAWDYIQLGRTNGDDIGSTGRYAEDHREVAGQKFYVAASDERPYYSWGYEDGWRERVQIFVPDDPVDVVDPATLGSFRTEPPFVLFLSDEAAAEHGRALTQLYPTGRLEKVTPHGWHMAFTVPAP